MLRSHFVWAAACAAVVAAAAVACSDSSAPLDLAEPDAGGDGTDASTSGRSDASVLPQKDSGASSSGAVDSGPAPDAGPPSVSVTSLDFGSVDCGKTGDAKTFQIANPTGASIAFSTELVRASASPFTIAPASGSVPAGGSIEVTVTPKPVTVPSPTTANALGDTIKLTIGSLNAQVDLKQSARGASIHLTTNSGTDFGNVSISAGGAQLPLQIANSGNVPAPITLSVLADPSSDGSANAFAIVDTDATPSPTTASPGVTAAQLGFTPGEVASYGGTVHLAVGDVPLCDVVPSDLAFTGKGTNGVVAISPIAFTFGNANVATTDCGTQAPPQVAHVTNSSNAPFTIKSAALGKGTSFYSLSSGATTGKDTLSNITVAAHATADITIVPKLIPQNNATNPTVPDGFADALTIATDAPGDTDPHVIPLHQTAHGAYIVRSTNATLNLGTVAIGVTSAPATFAWQNTGNADINLTQSMQGGAPYDVTPTALALSAGAASTTASVTFTPSSAGTFTDAINVVQKVGESVVLCNTLPGGLGTTGVGGNAQLVANNSATSSTLSFGGIACGTAAPSSKALKIQNNGPAGTFTATLRKGVSPFTLSSTGGAIAAGETITIQATPKSVGSDIGTIADQTDVVDISSDTAGNTPAVTLTYTPQGAIVSFGGKLNVAFTNQKVGTTSTPQNIAVTNNGNLSVPLTFTTATTSPGGATAIFAGVPTTSTVQPGAASALITALTFTPATNVTYGGTWTVAADTGAVLCAPLPQGQTAISGVLPLSGTGTP